LWLTPSAADMTEEDWKFPEGRFLAYVLGPAGKGQGSIFIVLNAAPEEIAFKLPKMSEYKSWRQVLNTTEATTQTGADFASGADTKAPSRSVLAFAGMA
jgi:isoamylase